MGAASDRLRFLVLDAYPPEGREALRKAGASEAGALYARMLSQFEPGARIDVACPADPDPRLPKGAALAGYDAVAWTGSSLTIHHEGDDRVRRQVEFARAVLEAGLPSFGSCWAAQVAAVAAGGRCAASPRGREFGVSRKITLSPEGRAHPLYEGKPAVFDAFTSHGDEVVELPASGTLLAANRFSRVQALVLTLGPGSFWAVQYHPEYDLHEVASLCRVRADELVAQGTFADRAALDAWVADLETLHRDPARGDLAWRLGLDEDVLDPQLRQLEARNWIEHRVKPGVRR